MTQKLFLGLIGFVALQCLASSPVVAQTQGVPPNCLVTQRWDWPNPMMFGWSFLSEYPGTFAYLIWAPKASCAPRYSGSETCPTCPAAGSPISLNTGNTFIKETDVHVPGLGGGLSLTRTWNSIWPNSIDKSLNNSVFGANWRSTYEEEIFMGGDGYIKYARSDGSFWSFGINDVGRTDLLLNRGSWVFAAPSSEMGFLNTQGRMWILTLGNGEVRQFDPGIGGKLVAIFDRNKNETDILYDNYSRLSQVSNIASGQVYVFTYGGTNAFLVTSVTSNFGISLTYTYNTLGQLTQVTEPDSSTLNFAYNTQKLITSVTDMNGKVLESHTYDSQSRGLTSVRALGVDAVTLTYPNP